MTYEENLLRQVNENNERIKLLNIEIEILHNDNTSLYKKLINNR